jgi:hypothetical protein
MLHVGMCSTLDIGTRGGGGGGETYFPLVGGTDSFDRTWLPRLHNFTDPTSSALASLGVERYLPSPSASTDPPAQSVRFMLSAVDELGSAPFCGRTPARSSLRIRPSEREAVVMYALPPDCRVLCSELERERLWRSFHRRVDLSVDVLAVHRACPSSPHHLVAAVPPLRPRKAAVNLPCALLSVALQTDQQPTFRSSLL